VFFLTIDLPLKIIRHLIEPLRKNDILLNRLFFSLDVKSHQRDIYKSDQFNIRTDKPNGRIARVQGIKTAEEKMLQVLPRLRVSVLFIVIDNRNRFSSRFLQ
jgi:hypothetical protein